MNFINEWKSPLKQWDKTEFQIRIGKITLFALNLDFSKKYFRFTILNLTLQN